MMLLARFDPEKALNAILYVAGQVSDPTFHRVSKLLYFADKAHLAKYGRLICGDTYIAMKHGRVPSAVYDMLKAVRGNGESCHADLAAEAFAVEGDRRIRILRESDEDVFSDSDLECLNEAIERYGRLSFGALTDLSHDAAWLATDDNDVMPLELIIETLPDGQALLDHLRGASSSRQP